MKVSAGRRSVRVFPGWALSRTRKATCPRNQADQAFIRDRHPVRVARQVFEHLRGAAQRLFRIHDPVVPAQRNEPPAPAVIGRAVNHCGDPAPTFRSVITRGFAGRPVSKRDASTVWT